MASQHEDDEAGSRLQRALECLGLILAIIAITAIAVQLLTGWWVLQGIVPLPNALIGVTILRCLCLLDAFALGVVACDKDVGTHGCAQAKVVKGIVGGLIVTMLGLQVVVMTMPVLTADAPLQLSFNERYCHFRARGVCLDRNASAQSYEDLFPAGQRDAMHIHAAFPRPRFRSGMPPRALAMPWENVLDQCSNLLEDDDGANGLQWTRVLETFPPTRACDKWCGIFVSAKSDTNAMSALFSSVEARARYASAIASEDQDSQSPFNLHRDAMNAYYRAYAGIANVAWVLQLLLVAVRCMHMMVARSKASDGKEAAIAATGNDTIKTDIEWVKFTSI